MAKETKEVATSPAFGMVTMEKGQVPDYIKQSKESRGSEDVGMDDLVIPRLELVQSLSPCRDKDDPAYIPGAEEGMLYNNVSRELYGDKVYIIPVIFKKEYLIWKDRNQGGGFRGAYKSMEEANQVIVDLVNKGKDGGDPDGSLTVNDTAQHLCLIMKPDGKTEEIAISMSRSKMKVSRQFNSLIRMNGGDRFSRVYLVEGVKDENDKGEKFKNLRITTAGWPSQEAYKTAEDLYNAIISGERELNINADQEGGGEGDTEVPKGTPNF